MTSAQKTPRRGKSLPHGRKFAGGPSIQGWGGNTEGHEVLDASREFVEEGERNCSRSKNHTSYLNSSIGAKVTGLFCKNNCRFICRSKLSFFDVQVFLLIPDVQGLCVVSFSFKGNGILDELGEHFSSMSSPACLALELSNTLLGDCAAPQVEFCCWF